MSHQLLNGSNAIIGLDQMRGERMAIDFLARTQCKTQPVQQRRFRGIPMPAVGCFPNAKDIFDLLHDQAPYQIGNDMKTKSPVKENLGS